MGSSPDLQHSRERSRSADRKSSRKRHRKKRSTSCNRRIKKHHKRKRLNSGDRKTSAKCHRRSWSSSSDSEKSKRRNEEDGKNDSHDSSNSFTFETYRNELNQVLIKDKKLNVNAEEFWLFLRKYENTKKVRETNTTFSLDRSLLFCFNITITVESVHNNLPSSTDINKNLTLERIKEFVQILHAYIDCKQKEKFNKLKKLRQGQKELPVAAYEAEIIEAVRNEKVVIIAGDTGCGKSTQIPQYLLKGGFKNLCCTQPRRIACISLAKRLAFETLNEYTNKVGYQIRFEKQRSRTTEILFMTEGLLLRQISSDYTLSNYSVVVLDEVHERHLYGDFLLGLLKCLLYKKDDFKLILMSATINIKLFADYFGGNARVIQIPGRLYPVQLYYRPISQIEIMKQQLKSSNIDPGPYVQVLQLIDNKYPPSERGDVLIFLSGMNEITRVVDAIKEYNIVEKRWIVLPLHSSLSLKEQDKVFDYVPPGLRKCIVSTNIAETSITISGIRFVVDSGKVKEMSYDAVQKLQKLKEFWISAASAEQRKGRAGRTGPGVCFRIYSEDDYSSLDPYSTPEIQRVPLDAILLQISVMGLPDVRKFPFLDPPNAENVESSIMNLKLHGALSYNEKVTPLGKMLSNLPIDITLGKMLIMATLFEQVETMIICAALLSVQTPFTNKAFRDFECEKAWKEFESDHGDPITLLNLYREWLRIKKDRKDSRQWCKKRGLEEQRFYETMKLASQFRDLLTDSGLLEKATSVELTSSERAIRNGEIKLLKNMKRDHKNSSKGRRMLKSDFWDLDLAEEKDEVDIKDIEFRLTNDQYKVDEILNRLQTDSLRDMTIIKIIFCCGLYPQLAIKDELNDIKSKSEQLYHTKNRAYIFLHPLSYFGQYPDWLKLQEPDIVVPSDLTRSTTTPFSSRHQSLCYLSIIETNKIYLTNSLRMPSLQTFLLFSREIDINFDFTRVICDSWVLFDVLNPLQSETLFLKLVKVRKMWDSLLNMTLDMKHSTSSSSVEAAYNLTTELISFLNTDIVYSMKRLLPAYLNTTYIGTNSWSKAFDVNPFDEDFQMQENIKKGGVFLTDYLTFGCVSSPEHYDCFKTILFECSVCKVELELNCIERIKHKSSCKKESAADKSACSSNINSNEFYCDICKKNFSFNSIQVLKHKKQHLVPS